MSSPFCTCIPTLDWKNFQDGKEIGHGLNGSIFQFQLNGKGVVVKPLTPPTLEPQALAAVQHAHIVKLLGVINQGDVPSMFMFEKYQNAIYLVMELYTGGSVDQYNIPDSKGILSMDERRTILIQLCEAVGFMHQQGWAHGDIAIRNILLDEKRQAFVGDMGLAVPMLHSMLPVSVSPEFLHDTLDAQANDIWQIGITMLELFVGDFLPRNHDFHNYSRKLLRTKQLSNNEELPWSLLPKLSPWLQPIAKSCLQVPIADRVSIDQLSVLLDLPRIPPLNDTPHHYDHQQYAALSLNNLIPPLNDTRHQYDHPQYAAPSLDDPTPPFPSPNNTQPAYVKLASSEFYDTLSVSDTDSTQWCDGPDEPSFMGNLEASLKKLLPSIPEDFLSDLVSVCERIDSTAPSTFTHDAKKIHNAGRIVERLEIIQSMDCLVEDHHLWQEFPFKKQYLQDHRHLWQLCCHKKIILSSTKHQESEEAKGQLEIENLSEQKGQFGQVARVSVSGPSGSSFIRKTIRADINDSRDHQVALIHECLVGQQMNDLVLKKGLTHFPLTVGLTSNENSNWPSELYMERVEGKLLAARLKSNNLPRFFLRDLIIQVGSALVVAGQAREFNHSDLHPDNIIIRPHGPRTRTISCQTTFKYEISQPSSRWFRRPLQLKTTWEPVLIDYGRSAVTINDKRYVPLVSDESLVEASHPERHEFLMDMNRFLVGLDSNWSRDSDERRLCEQVWQLLMNWTPDIQQTVDRERQAFMKAERRVPIKTSRLVVAYGSDVIPLRRCQLDRNQISDGQLWMNVVKKLLRRG
jgi:serine/threonine protein kinase